MFHATSAAGLWNKQVPRAASSNSGLCPGFSDFCPRFRWIQTCHCLWFDLWIWGVYHHWQRIRILRIYSLNCQPGTFEQFCGHSIQFHWIVLIHTSTCKWSVNCEGARLPVYCKHSSCPHGSWMLSVALFELGGTDSAAPCHGEVICQPFAELTSYEVILHSLWFSTDFVWFWLM